MKDWRKKEKKSERRRVKVGNNVKVRLDMRERGRKGKRRRMKE